MRIHGLCLVKNESDIIHQGLRAARKWCDHIYVFDNGSTDGTWEIVQDLAAADRGIVAWKQDPVRFSDSLRCAIFHAFKGQAEPGDWWARVDPDEFYVDEPRAFLSAVPRTTGYVWYASLSFYFSTDEARRFEEDPNQFDSDVPIIEKCRHYFNHWSEIRFVRHEHMEPWKGEGEHFWPGWPEKLLYRARSHNRRIMCRHFPYRSPIQIERRLVTRAAAAVEGGEFWHEAAKDWNKTFDPISLKENRVHHKWKKIDFEKSQQDRVFDWRSRIIDASHLNFDGHDGIFVLNEGLMPSMPRFHPVYYCVKESVRRIFRRGLRTKLTPQ